MKLIKKTKKMAKIKLWKEYIVRNGMMKDLSVLQDTPKGPGLQRFDGVARCLLKGAGGAGTGPEPPRRRPGAAPGRAFAGGAAASSASRLRVHKAVDTACG